MDSTPIITVRPVRPRDRFWSTLEDKTLDLLLSNKFQMMVGGLFLDAGAYFNHTVSGDVALATAMIAIGTFILATGWEHSGRSAAQSSAVVALPGARVEAPAGAPDPLRLPPSG